MKNEDILEWFSNGQSRRSLIYSQSTRSWNGFLFHLFCIHCDLQSTKQKTLQKHQQKRHTKKPKPYIIIWTKYYTNLYICKISPRTQKQKPNRTYIVIPVETLPSGKIQIKNCQNKQKKTEIKHFLRFKFTKNQHKPHFYLKWKQHIFYVWKFVNHLFIVFFINIGGRSRFPRVSRI